MLGSWWTLSIIEGLRGGASRPDVPVRRQSARREAGRPLRMSSFNEAPMLDPADGPDAWEPIVYDRADVAGAALVRDDAEAFARSVFDASPDCIKLVAMDGSLEFMNANGMCAMEIDDFDTVRGAPWPALWPDTMQERVGESLRVAAAGGADRFEAFCPTAKGTPRWWEVSVTPVLDEGGRPKRVLSISRDITERVERERSLRRHEQELERTTLSQGLLLGEKERLLAEKTLLMQEIDHRVKNSLALINSLLRVQARTVGEGAAQEALRHASARVHSIASVHEKLYQQGSVGEVDLADYLGGLCDELASTARGTGVRLEVDVAEAGTAEARDAAPIGLIVTELVTNAVRHASPEGDPCVIRVECRRVDGRRELIVEDDGCGLPDGFDPANSKGLGMRVVLGNIDRFGGSIEAGERHGGGTRFRIRL